MEQAHTQGMIRDVIIPTFHNRISHRDWHPILTAFQGRNQHPILVIGADGDDLLLQCPASRETDLVYDAHAVSDFWTSLFAGSQAVEGAAFVLNPVHASAAQQLMLNHAAWAQLEFQMREILYMSTPGVISSADDSLWLINSSAMKIIRDLEVQVLPERVKQWRANAAGAGPQTSALLKAQ